MNEVAHSLDRCVLLLGKSLCWCCVKRIVLGSREIWVKYRGQLACLDTKDILKTQCLGS